MLDYGDKHFTIICMCAPLVGLKKRKNAFRALIQTFKTYISNIAVNAARVEYQFVMRGNQQKVEITLNAQSALKSFALTTFMSLKVIITEVGETNRRRKKGEIC